MVVIKINRPRFPKMILGIISLVMGIPFSIKLNGEALSDLLDFLGIITPILFSAFGIWIGVIDPSKILFNKNDQTTTLTQEDNTVYKLCYFLMYCTFILIAIIILKFFFITASSWNGTLLKNSFTKICLTSIITFLYLSILWVSLAVLFPLIKAIGNFEKIEAENKHFG